MTAPQLQHSPTLPSGVRLPDMMRVGLIAELDKPSPETVLQQAEQVRKCRLAQPTSSPQALMLLEPCNSSVLHARFCFWRSAL